MISIDNLRFRSLAIDRLRIAPGVTAVTGPNGSGKTTLLRLLAGILVPAAGTILIDTVPPRDAEIGWVNEFPDRNILFSRVAEEIASPLRFRHLPCEEIENRVQAAMEMTGTTHLATRPVREISGGEKALIALAAALVIRPRVLILDEYDSHLDARCSGRLGEIVGKSGVPYIIHCTQDMETAARADRMLFLDGGTISQDGTPADIFPRLADTAFYPLSWSCRK